MAIIGHGSKLTIVGPVSGTAVNLDLACLSIDNGSNKIDAADSTDMLTTGTQRVYTAGLEAPGDVTVKYNSNPVDFAQAALLAAKGILYNFKIVYPGNVWSESFQGIVTSVDESAPDDKFITRTAKIQKSGATVEAQPGPLLPIVLSVVPNSGLIAGGKVVVLNGDNFTGATSVKFGATSATSFSVVNDQQLAVISPSSSAGTVDVTVITPVGTSATGINDKYTSS
jgi:Lambda phage tail tube protein, TTP/IPT/TIG domain